VADQKGGEGGSLYSILFIKRALALTLGLGPLSGVSIGRLSGVGALWNCVSLVCGGGGGCAGGDVPLWAVLVLSWCGEVSLGGKHIIFTTQTRVKGTLCA